MRAAAYPDGTVLCSEDAIPRQAFMILNGTVEVTRDGQHVASLGRGDIVGEQALLNRVPRNATVTSVGDIEVVVISPDEFLELVQDPEVMAGMTRIVAQRQANTGCS
jgi:CRP/FNR family cyclic AMP-dependent transcriptional regulator